VVDGIIVIDKPQGWTSFDVVKKLRGITKTRKVGHSGTLDPMATGVLPLFFGAATKQVSRFMRGKKGYAAEMTLGVVTDSQDADGKVLRQNAVARDITPNEISAVFSAFTGPIEQVPPMVSAVKINGERLYKLARKGIEVKRKPRKVVIHELNLTGIEGSRIRFFCLCSKGTYVRTLASDIGDRLGFGAHLSSLRRTMSEPFTEKHARSIGQVEEAMKSGDISSLVLNPDDFIVESC